MRNKHMRRVVFISVAIIVFASAQPAMAAFRIITVHAEAGGLQADAFIQTDIDMDVVAQNPDETYSWKLENPRTLVDGSVVLGTINELSMSYKNDPVVTLGFLALAGATDTSFTFSSGGLTWSPSMINPTAIASAGVSFTDKDGNGASFSGDFSGGEAYQARYNATDTVWASLLSDDLIAGSWLTKVDGDDQSGVINATVNEIDAIYKFTLSANDVASGTSTFRVIPEPATICLLGLGVLSLIKKRKA